MNPLTEKAKVLKEQISFTDFLSRLGYEPKRTKGHESMYISMVRDSDTDASFSVNEKLGAWYDHGMGKGGNIFDFGKLYWPDLDFAEIVDKVRQICDLSIDLPEGAQRKASRPRIREAVKIPNYKIEKVLPFGSSEGINTYLKGRGIFEVAADRLQEIHYYVEDEKKLRKRYFAAGWQNESGGWEIRNKYFKGCLGKKGITMIPGDPKKLVVFEGYMNYLSWRRENPSSNATALVLNSLALLERGLDKGKAFPEIDVYLDRDKSGYTALAAWMKALPYSTDRSELYKGMNDYNDKIIADIKLARKLQNQVR
ncbi:hypothetical protein [Pedobacter sp. GR22-6]|uniref:hypothetical protein n=1 Tax=Pedobacter sp. GR22-6 TaxID=3127957 RepID=UPI00307CF025